MGEDEVLVNDYAYFNHSVDVGATLVVALF